MFFAKLLVMALLLLFARGFPTSCAKPKKSFQFRFESTDSVAYDELVSQFATSIQLERVGSLMHWDTMVTMPQTDGHHKQRGLQSAALAGAIHEAATAPKLRELIDAVDVTLLDKVNAENFKLMEKR